MYFACGTSRLSRLYELFARHVRHVEVDENDVWIELADPCL